MIQRRISILFFLLALWPMFLLAQHDKTAYYEPASYEYAGVTLPYRMLKLNQEQAGKSVLVIQLHGGTARGDDNKAQLDASAVDSVETYLRVHKMKAVFLLPQCGKDRVWNESARQQPVPMTDVLAQWLQDFLTTHDIDTDRIYMTGYSAGGSGAWRMVNDCPQLFAAACIAAANPLMVEEGNVCRTPIYAVAGSKDNIMDADKIGAFVRSLTALGGEAQFDLLEDKDHFGTCDAAFSRERLVWLFGHTRKTTDGIRPVNTDTLPATLYGLDGMPRTPQAKGFLIQRLPDGSTKKVLVR